jgi:hypothetical protein
VLLVATNASDFLLEESSGLKVGLSHLNEVFGIVLLLGIAFIASTGEAGEKKVVETIHVFEAISF